MTSSYVADAADIPADEVRDDQRLLPVGHSAEISVTAARAADWSTIVFLA